MAYTLTLPTLKLPSGDLVVSFYCTGTSGTTSTLTHSYITDLGEVNKEVEIQSGEFIFSSINLSIWDKDSTFRDNLINDLHSGNDVKVTFTLGGATQFIGVIDKYTISIKQKYLNFSGNDVIYVAQSNGIANPIEVIEFSVKDILSLLENITPKQLKDSVGVYKSSSTLWGLNNSRYSQNIGSQDFYFISIRQLIREIFKLLSPSLIKINVHIDSNYFSCMSKDYFDLETSYHLGSASPNETLNNTTINKAKSLNDMYLIFYRSVDGYGGFFSESTSSSDNTVPAESIFNFENCSQLFNNIVYTFGLVIVPDYFKKSINSVSIDGVGSGYNLGSTQVAQISGGNGSGASISLIDTYSLGVMSTAVIVENGENYTTTPSLIIPPPTTTNQATATAIISPTTTAITGFTITNYGGYYNQVDPPNIVISPPPLTRTAQLEAYISGGSVSQISLNDDYGDNGGSGSGYSSTPLPTLIITPAPKGSGNIDATAVVTAVSNGRVTGVSITNSGSGYAAPPTIRCSAPTDAVQCNATVNVVGFIAPISSISISNPSSNRGYTSLNPPIVYIDPPDLGGQASATCSLSDFDVYIKLRNGLNSSSINSTELLDSDINNVSDAYLDKLSISTKGYSQHTHDITEISYIANPKSIHQKQTLFGLLNSNGIAYSSYVDNHLIIEAQFKSDATNNDIVENKFFIPRFIHNNINLFKNTRLINSNNWTLNNATHSGNSGVNYNGNDAIYTTGHIGMQTQTSSDNPTKYIIGSLSKIIYGEPLVFSAWVKKSGSECHADSLYVQALDSSNNVIVTNNISMKQFIDIDVGSKVVSTSQFVMVAFGLDPLDYKSGISKIKMFFTGSPDSSSTISISYPQLFVGAETFSRWLANNYYKYFQKPSSTITRKYYGLVSTDLRIGNYITDNGEIYYIKRISKNLVDNETEIEAINYST